MKWGAPSIAQFARDAGFFPPDLHTATAIALAGSGGLDNYDMHAGIPGAGRYVGLWAINVVQWPDYTADELVVPARAAQAAHELTERLGGFGWSAVWRARNERRFLDVAASGSTRLPWGETEHAPMGITTAHRQIHAMGQRLRKVRDDGDRLRRH